MIMPFWPIELKTRFCPLLSISSTGDYAATREKCVWDEITETLYKATIPVPSSYTLSQPSDREASDNKSGLWSQLLSYEVSSDS